MLSVIIRSSPMNDLRVSEGLRMSVGLTLSEDKVQVFFLDEGVYVLLGVKPEKVGLPQVEKHLSTLKALGCKLVAEKESLDERGIESPKYSPQIVTQNELSGMVALSDVVITY